MSVWVGHVLGMSVVRGMRWVDVVCEMCMCIARGGVGDEGDEWIRGLGLYFTNPVEQGECCMYLGCGGAGVGGEWVVGLEQCLEGRGGVISVWVVSPDYLFRWQVQVSVYCARRISVPLRCNQCSILLIIMIIITYFSIALISSSIRTCSVRCDTPYRYLFHTVYLFMADIANYPPS